MEDKAKTIEYTSTLSISKDNPFTIEEVKSPCTVCSIREQKESEIMGSRVTIYLRYGFAAVSMCPEHEKQWRTPPQVIGDLLIPYFQ